MNGNQVDSIVHRISQNENLTPLYLKILKLNFDVSKGKEIKIVINFVIVVIDTHMRAQSFDICVKCIIIKQILHYFTGTVH